MVNPTLSNRLFRVTLWSKRCSILLLIEPNYSFVHTKKIAQVDNQNRNNNPISEKRSAIIPLLHCP